MPTLPRLALAALALLLASGGAARGEDAAVDAPAPSTATAEVRALVEALMPDVARMRGLEWKRPVPSFALPREKLVEHMLAKIDVDYPPEERERDDRVLHRLGLLAPDETLLDIVLAMLRDTVAGFYEPDTGHLYLIEGPVGEGMKPTLVHELTHALDDQHYDLDGMEDKYEDDPDRQFAGRCLFEGCAVCMQHHFEEANPSVAYIATKQQATDESLGAGMQRAISNIPAFLFVSTLLHYRVGPALVGRMTKGSFGDRMAKLWSDPPTTQEQFLHPERWVDPARRDHPRTITMPADLATALGDGWTSWYGHTVGELDLALSLDFFLGGRRGRLDMTSMTNGTFVHDKAFEAARGWDAGRAEYFDFGGERLVVVHAFAFDGADDAKEAVQAFRDVLELRGHTSSEPTPGEAGVDVVRYETEHGSGWIARRGNEVLAADGVPGDRLDAFVAALSRTTFTQSPKDRGDAGAPDGPLDPLGGCVLVDRRRGVGLRALPDGWTAQLGKGPQFAIVRGPQSTVIQFIVAEQGLTTGALSILLEAQLPGFDAAKLRDARIANLDGRSYPLVTAPRDVEMRVGSDGMRTYVAVVMTSPEGRAAYGTDIETVLNAIVSKASY